MTEPRCGARTRAGRPCYLRAKTTMDGMPLCTQHAAVAARRAAEAAREAAFWEEEFTPTPEQPYRADPEWQAARRVMLSDRPDVSAAEALPGRIEAIYRIRDIEAAHEAATRG